MHSHPLVNNDYSHIKPRSEVSGEKCCSVWMRPQIKWVSAALFTRAERCTHTQTHRGALKSHHRVGLFVCERVRASKTPAGKSAANYDAAAAPERKIANLYNKEIAARAWIIYQQQSAICFNVDAAAQLVCEWVSWWKINMYVCVRARAHGERE